MRELANSETGDDALVVVAAVPIGVVVAQSWRCGYVRIPIVPSPWRDRHWIGSILDDATRTWTTTPGS